ncbi:MAG: hypothetical protein WD114_05295 [Phycisphaerales bacterium]
MNEDHQTHETEPIEEWERADTIARPKWPKVIGIISIVLGSLGLVCGGLGLVATPLASKFMEGALEGDPVPYGMVPTAADYIIMGLSVVLALLLLFAGITAVAHRPVTRVMHIVYALLSIPMSIWSYLNQMEKAELNAQWARDFPDNQMAQGMDPSNAGAAAGQIFGLIVLLVFGIGLPVFYLIWFGLIKTKPEQITGGEEGVY